MNRDFEIVDGTYLVQASYELDLHNDFDFIGLNYAVKTRSLVLNWQRSAGEWVSKNTPEFLNVEFREVSEYRFLPRDAEIPFTEDDCVNSFGYWVDEDRSNGVFQMNSSKSIDSKWLTAIEFMSGAVIAVQATTAYARIIA